MRSIGFICHLGLTILMLLSTGFSRAQVYNASPADSALGKSNVRLGIRYTSDYIYMGRADSEKAPYLSPYVGYYHKSGFFINGSLSYLMATAENRIDLYTMSGGYDHYGKKYALGVSLTEYFFNDLSYSVQADMKTYLNATAGYDFSAFIVYADASLGFSENTDVFLGLEVNRRFYLLKHKLWFTPSLYMNAGSQQYYEEYYMTRSNKPGGGMGQGGHNAPSSTSQDVQVLESNKFKVLDYETALQLVYKIQRTRIFGTATWTFPVNPSTVLVDQVPTEEKLSNGFFWIAGVRFTF